MTILAMTISVMTISPTPAGASRYPKSTSTHPRRKGAPSRRRTGSACCSLPPVRAGCRGECEQRHLGRRPGEPDFTLETGEEPGGAYQLHRLGLLPDPRQRALAVLRLGTTRQRHTYATLRRGGTCTSRDKARRVTGARHACWDVRRTALTSAVPSAALPRRDGLRHFSLLLEQRRQRRSGHLHEPDEG